MKRRRLRATPSTERHKTCMYTRRTTTHLQIYTPREYRLFARRVYCLAKISVSQWLYKRYNGFSFLFASPAYRSFLCLLCIVYKSLNISLFSFKFDFFRFRRACLIFGRSRFSRAFIFGSPPTVFTYNVHLLGEYLFVFFVEKTVCTKYHEKP